jgi:ClpP class serine protease
MRYPHLLAALRDTVWACLPSTVEAVGHTLQAHLAGGPRAALPGAGLAVPSPSFAVSPGSLAVIPAHGIVGKHLSALETECGGLDLDALLAQVSAALAEPAIAAVVLHFDSPGGTAVGNSEAAAQLRGLQAATGKPVYGFTDTLSASAAYCLMSACAGIGVTPSATVGSIGTFCQLVDESGAWAQAGLKLHVIKSGPHKAAGMPGEPVTEAVLAQFQSIVDGHFSLFRSAVLTGRPAVAVESMQGQTFMGQAAVDAGLADALVGSFDEYLTLVASTMDARQLQSTGR